VSSGVAGLCHGDASPWNLLLSNDRRLMLIDPRGLAGEVAYDLAVVAIKAASVAPPAITAPYLAHQVEADPDRVLAWVSIADAARV
jgi:streptomycin 6-kinase